MNGSPTFQLTRPASDPSVWKELAALWQRGTQSCPFQSPGILRYFSDATEEETLVLACKRDGSLHAAVVLKLDQGGKLSFLSDLKTDLNRFLFDPVCSALDKAGFFDFILGTIKEQRWSWTLNNQATEEDHTALLELRAEEAGLYNLGILHSARPVVEAATPAELYAHVHGFRELRYRVNRLVKQPGTTFEVFTDDRELDAWTDAFCNVHMLKWSGTPTPSSFRDPVRREFLRGCLKAWNADGLLVRFSIRSGAERIGFVVGLRNGDTLIHHSTTYHPEHARASPGKALIHAMAEWMSGNGFRTLDFGDGREEYKYSVATGERPMKRIFISTKSDLAYILSTSVIRTVNSSPRLYGIYQKHIKKLLKS